MKEGVSLALVGRVSKITLRQKGDEVGLLRKRYSFAGAELEVKLFDIQSGREILASVKSGDVTESALVAIQGNGLEEPTYRAELTQEAIRQAVYEFVPQILKTLDKAVWQGRIAKVNGAKVFINAGRASGLLSGDILRVLSSGDDIYDPTTGSYLGRSQGKLKGTLEVTEFIGADGGVTDIHSGANFQEGDLVQLY